MVFSGTPVELFQCAAALIGTGALLVWIGLSHMADEDAQPTWIVRLAVRMVPQRPDLAFRIGRSYAACAGIIGLAVGLVFLVAAFHAAA